MLHVLEGAASLLTASQLRSAEVHRAAPVRQSPLLGQCSLHRPSQAKALPLVSGEEVTSQPTVKACPPTCLLVGVHAGRVVSSV